VLEDREPAPVPELEPATAAAGKPSKARNGNG
jgi:hypothetical protein